MITKKLFYTLLISACTLSACQKDLDLFVPGPVTLPDSTWYNAIGSAMPVSILKENLLLNISKDSFVLNSSTGTLLTSSGLECTIMAGSLVSSSSAPVTGNIKIESYLLKKKGDMIRMGTPTTSNGRLLVSGGEFFLRILKNDSALQVSQNGLIHIKYADSPVSPLMKLFNGIATNTMAFNWLPITDSINQVFAFNQYYEVITNQLNWINCDYFYDTTGIAQTIVSAGLPYNYTNANTIAYLVFNDMRSVIGMYGNAATRKFSSGKLPANKPITVIVISKQGNDYYLGHQQAITTGQPGTVGAQEVNVTPVLTSLNDIKAYLNTL